MSWTGVQMRADSGTPDLAFEIDIPPEMTQAMTADGQLAARISRREALQVPAVLRSRNLIAGSLSRLPMHVYDSDHRVATPTTLLDQIDPDIPNVVTMAETYEDLLFQAVAWWRVTERGWHGYPTFAEHITPSRVSVGSWTIPVDGTLPSTVVGPMRVYIDGRPVPDEDVIRFDSPNPPLLVHAARAIRTCLALDMTASSYSGTPVPLGYFTPREGTHPKEDPNEIEAMLSKWEAARRRRVWGYIGQAWDVKSLAFNAEQIQLADQRQHAVLEIARACGIDPEDLGVSTTSRTYQNSEQRRLDFLDFTLAPYMSAVESRLSMRDVLPRGYRTRVNLDGFLRADTMTRMNAYKVGLEVKAYTYDEIRDLEDRPPLTPAQRAEGQPPPLTPPVSPQQMPTNGNTLGGDSNAMAR